MESQIDTVKQRSIEQWTSDPCGPSVEAQPGSREYAEELIAGRQEYAPWMAKMLDYEASAGLDVLDVGCGQGIDVMRYAAAGARVTGIDLTPRHVELAKLNLRAVGLEADVALGDAENLPFEDNSFDRVSSNGVLHHTPNIGSALQEIRRVLRPGGLFTIIVYNRNSVHFWLHQLAWRGIFQGRLLSERGIAGVLSSGVENSSIGARPLVKVYTRRGIRDALRRSGLRVLDDWVCPVRPTDSHFTRWMSRPANVPLGWYLVCRATPDSSGETVVKNILSEA